MSGLTFDQAALVLHHAGRPGTQQRASVAVSPPPVVRRSRLDMVMALPQVRQLSAQTVNPWTRDRMVSRLERNQQAIESRDWLDNVRLRAAGNQRYGYRTAGFWQQQGNQFGGLSGFG